MKISEESIAKYTSGFSYHGCSALLSLAKPDLQNECWRSGIHGSFHWPRPAHGAVWLTCQTSNHSLFRSASHFGVWKCCHNNRQVCKTLRRILKILCRELEIFHILLKIQRLVDPYKRSSSDVNATAFFFREGVWRHRIFVAGGTLKNATHTSPGNPIYSTNPMTTLKLLKCFHFCMPYASDI